MSWEIAKRSVDFAVSLTYYSDGVSIGFTSAEPLMEWQLVKRVIKYAQSKGVRRFCIATNALLINESILKYSKRNNVSFQISIDGDDLVCNSNRIFKNSKGSFDALDNRLDLIKTYLNKNYIEIRITFTPFTVKYLSESVHYIIKKNLSSNCRINMRPVVIGVKWRQEHFQMFKEEILKISKFFINNLKNQKYHNICYAECMPGKYIFLQLYENKDMYLPSCSAGEEKLSVDIDGNIYPCHILAPSKYKKKKKFILGDVWSGIIFPERIKKFRGEKSNPFLSCFTWNYLINNNPAKALKVYLELYQSWQMASKYVNKKLFG